MSKAGLKLVEVVLRTEASLEALSAIKTEVPSLIVGAGTVINEEILAAALEVGSDFIVTPAVSASLLGALKSCQVPVLPGVSNTADILMTLEAGFTEQKLFPASLSGGAPFLRAVSSVFRSVTFAQLVALTSQTRWTIFPCQMCLPLVELGSAKEWVNEGNWDAITQSCLEANA